MHAYCGQLGHHKQSSSQHSPKSPSLEAIFLAPLSLPYLFIYFFFFFTVEGILENRGPAVFPSCPITDDFPTLIQSSANTRVNGCPLTPQCTSFAIHGTTHQLLSSGCLKVTAVWLRKKNQSCIQFSLGFSYSSLVNSTKQVVPERLGPF